MTDRAAYIAGLRQLADLLDANDVLPIPYAGSQTGTPIALYLLAHADDTRERFVQSVRALPGKRTKEVEDIGETFRVAATLGGEGGLRVQVVAYRETVCERVVKGTREVTRDVTVYDAPLPPSRVETVTETVEDVEWVCSPVLAPADA